MRTKARQNPKIAQTRQRNNDDGDGEPSTVLGLYK